MKKLYTLLFIVLLATGCKDNDDSEVKAISIENLFPQYSETEDYTTVDRDKVDLFGNKIMLINSTNQLKEKAIYHYYPTAVKTELENIDFNTYSLIMVTNTKFQIADSIQLSLTYYASSSMYSCVETFYVNRDNTQSANKIHFLINSFTIKKIPDNSDVFLSMALVQN